MTDEDHTDKSAVPQPEPFLKDIEANLQLRKNRSLRRAVDSLTSLAQNRWTKHVNVSPEEFSKKIESQMQNIQSALVSTNFGDPTTDDEKAQVKDEFVCFVYEKACSKWQTKDLAERDKSFASKSDDASAFIDADYMHIDERIVRDYGFIFIASLLKKIESSKTPLMKLQIIEQCNSEILNVMKQYDIQPDKGILTSAFVLLIAQARMKNLPSNLAFIDDFSDSEARKLPCYDSYHILCCAFTYLLKFSPNSHIVRCDLFDEELPESLVGRIGHDEYNSLLKPMRDLIKGDSSTTAVRFGGAGIGAAIGTALAAPLAVFVGVITVGFGAPFSAGIIALGAAVGSSLGAAMPLNARKQFTAMKEIVDSINSKLETCGFDMIDPALTNSIAATSTIKDIKEIEWVVRFVLPHYVQPEIPTEQEWEKFPIPQGASPEERQRINVVNEIISTEIEFAERMTFLVVAYARPLKDNPHGLTQEEYLKLFNDLDPILLVSRELIKVLKAGGQHGIGASFLSLSEFLKCYKTFCARHQTRIDLVNDIISRNPDFRSFLAEVKQLPESKKQDLDSFLMRPVQRICKYPLLLRELRKVTRDEGEIKEIELAMNKIQSVVDVINTSTRGIENQKSIHDLSLRFVNYPEFLSEHGELLTASRRLVKEAVITDATSFVVNDQNDKIGDDEDSVALAGSISGSLSSSSGQLLSSNSLIWGATELILFNDILLLVREGSKRKLKIMEWFNLGDILLDPDYEKSDGKPGDDGTSKVGETFAILRPSDSTVFLMYDGSNVGWKGILSEVIPKRNDFEGKSFFVKDRKDVSQMKCGDCFVTYSLVDGTRYTVVFMTKFGVARRYVVRSAGGFMCPSLRYVADSENHPIVYSTMEKMLDALRENILSDESYLSQNEMTNPLTKSMIQSCHTRMFSTPCLYPTTASYLHTRKNSSPSDPAETGKSSGAGAVVPAQVEIPTDKESSGENAAPAIEPSSQSEQADGSVSGETVVPKETLPASGETVVPKESLSDDAVLVEDQLSSDKQSSDESVPPGVELSCVQEQAFLAQSHETPPSSFRSSLPQSSDGSCDSSCHGETLASLCDEISESSRKDTNHDETFANLCENRSKPTHERVSSRFNLNLSDDVDINDFDDG